VNDHKFETPKCIVCFKSPAARVLFSVRDRAYGNTGDYYLAECPNCKLIWLCNRPVFDQLERYYPQESYFKIPSPHEITFDEGAILRSNNLRDKITKAIYHFSPHIFRNIKAVRDWDIKEKKTILEVGFGTGHQLAQFASWGASVYGADLSSNSIKLAKAAGYRVLQMNEKRIDGPDDFFELIYLNQVFEHLPNPNASLIDYWRMLQPGGCLVMTLPNYSCKQAKKFKSEWRGIEAPRHLYFYTIQTLRMILKKNGFVDLDIYPVNLSPYDVFASNLPPTLEENEKLKDSWWNGRLLSHITSFFAPVLGYGESLYVCCRKPVDINCVMSFSEEEEIKF
jgi:2-polyprenyl-3-methyl-5-hydroxy-6-metoxy-1,4-benzoquinol methylase